MAGKRYGTMEVEKIELVPFELVAQREDEHGELQPEVHEFVARPQSDAGDLAAFAFATKDDGVQLMTVMVGMIRKMVINNDGTPAQWNADDAMVKKPKNAGDDYVEKFRGPDGKLWPMEERGRFEEISAGSSRRRLLHLLYEDDARVEMSDLAEVMKDMMAKAAERPTTAPSRF